MKGDRWGQVCERVGGVEEGSVFLTGGVQGTLNMSFGGRMLSGSPRKAGWGVECSGRRRWEQRGKII